MRQLSGILGLSCVLLSQAMLWAAPVKVLDGTRINVELAEELSSNRSKVGQVVLFRVRENVIIDNKLVVRANARATGQVIAAKGAGGLGRRGKLDFTLEKVEAVDGTMIPLRSTQTSSGKSGKGAMIAVTLLLSPLGLFMKGKNVKHPVGTPFQAFTDQVVSVDPDKSKAQTNAKTETKADTEADTETPDAAPAVADITPPADARAHKITLKSGRSETGVVTMVDGKTLTLVGEVGVLKIPVANIKSVSPQAEGTPQPMAIVLESGTQTSGKLVSMVDGMWKIETDDGNAQIKTANLTSMTMSSGARELK